MLGKRRFQKFGAYDMSKMTRHTEYLFRKGITYTCSFGRDADGYTATVVWWE